MIPFIFFSSLHLPAKKFQIREHCGMLHQFQTRHEYSKSESTKNVRVFAGQNSARKKKRRKNYERNIRKMRFLSSFYSLETFQKLQCLPKDYAITQPKFGKSFKPLNYMRKNVVHSLFGVSPLALMLRR